MKSERIIMTDEKAIAYLEIMKINLDKKGMGQYLIKALEYAIKKLGNKPRNEHIIKAVKKTNKRRIR